MRDRSGDMQLKFTRDFKIQDLKDLYDSVGWTTYTHDPSALDLAIKNSAYVASLWDGNQLVALARCISDDATIMYLQDILVSPPHQRCGCGTRLLSECLRRYEHVRQIVLLTDDASGQLDFYRKLGLINTKALNRGSLNTFVRFRDS